MSLSRRSTLLTGLGFRHGFSLRSGGSSRGPYESLNLGLGVGDDAACVHENLRRFAQELGLAPAQLFEVRQVHGARVEHVEAGAERPVLAARDADGLVSGVAGCAVGVRVADCASVLLADPRSGAVAALHAGWRGVVADIVAVAVQALGERHASAPSQLAAAVFPCIGLDAFEVGDEVAEQLAQAVGTRAVLRTGAARPHADLSLAVRLQLERAGLAAARIDTVAGCTYSDSARFFSFRRDAGVTGRHLAVILPGC